MISIKIKAVFVLLAFFFSTFLFSQEVLEYRYPSHVHSERTSLKSSTSVLDTFHLVQLPFYEDFARRSNSVNDQLWEQSTVFVNSFFAENAPSIGLATFDALNNEGNLQPTASTSSFPSDTLMSRPIALGNSQNTLYKITDDIGLSFYYQIGGLFYLKNFPSATDSLFLDFYLPVDSKRLVINETTVNKIELYNATDSAYSLEGLQLKVWSDTAQRSYTVQYGGNAFIQPYSHAVIDSSIVFMNGLTQSFSIFYGDSISMIDATGSHADTVRHLAQSSKDSYGRLVDGSTSFSTFTETTFHYPNGDWKRVWSIGGFTDKDEYTDEFTQVTIPITKQSDLVNGFRFRFTNTASLSNELTHARNGDIFNIDHIYLDTARTQLTDFPDVAFSTPITSLLRDYYTVPCTHLASRDENGSNSNASSHIFRIENFDASKRWIKYSLSVDPLDSGTKELVEMYETNLPSSAYIEDTVYFPQYINPFDVYSENTAGETSADFSVKLFFEDDVSDAHQPYRYNDTVEFIQSFSNYYAYDDGTSEAGYGVRSENSMAVSQKFNFYKEDTLRKVSIFFNPTLDDPKFPAKRFFLSVWADDNDKPGAQLYRSEYIIAVDDSRSKLNQFQYIDIESSGIKDGSEYLIISGKVHIGWEQTSDFLMDVGVDLNRSAASKINYRFGQTWTLALSKNPLMIRAHVGSDFSATKPQYDNERIGMYPNPANRWIYFTTEENLTVQIYSNVGSMVLNASVSGKEGMDVSVLPEGIYWVQISKRGEVLASQSLVLQR